MIKQSSFLLSHATGNENCRQVVRGLFESGLLGQFSTCIDGRRSNVSRLLPGSFQKQLSRRSFEFLPKELMGSAPFREIGRLTSSALHLNFLTKHEVGPFCIDRVIQAHDRRVAKQLSKISGIRAVYAYEDGALETFRAAKKLGITTIYELPIAYWETAKKLTTEELERYPAWKETMQGSRDSDTKLARKTEELALANVVICPSQFVLRSLPADTLKEKACYVVEYGADSTMESTQVPSVRQPDDRLKLLFVGSMTQRKGLADLFEAMKLLNRTDVELTVLGSPVVDVAFYKGQYPDFNYLPPRPRQEVLAVMAESDVFVLPSIVEGRALVQLEAISQGLPLLVTSNAGGEDLIVEGETGFLVPIRSPQALAEKISWFADNRSELPRMKQAALAMAQKASWTNFRSKIVDVVSKELEKRHGN